MTETYHGIVHAVKGTNLGDALSVAANIGDTVINVYDVTDFDSSGEGGTFRFRTISTTTLINYTTVDDDADTITLSAPLTIAAPVDCPVEVWDATNGQPALVYTATVDSVDGFDGDPVQAVVGHDLAHALAQTMKGDGNGESVTLVVDGSELRVHQIHGRNNALASLQYMQGGLTTRQDDTDAGVDIQGTDSGNPGIFLYDTGGVLAMNITDDAAGGVIKFHTGTTGESSGYINPGKGTFDGNSGIPFLSLSTTANPSGNGSVAGLFQVVGSTSTSAASVRTTVIYASGAINTQNGLNITGAGNTVNIGSPPTTTNAANANIGSSGFLNKVTSLSAHKVDQQPIDLDVARDLLYLTPKTWLDRTEVEEHGPEGLRRVPGLIAEDVERHAPDLATYDADGALEGVAYDRVAALLIPVIRDQQRQIDDLTARLTALEEN